MSNELDTPPSNEQETTTPPIENQETEPQKPVEEEKTSESEEEKSSEFVPLAVKDISLPEGFQVDEPLMNDFLSVVNDEKLDAKERANQLVGLYAKAQTAASETNSKAWETMQETWQKEVKEDTEVGGAKFENTITKVGKLMEEFGTDELRQAFDLTGAGNNVHVVRFLAKLSDKLTEGSYTQGRPSNTPSDAASKLFPSMKG